MRRLFLHNLSIPYAHTKPHFFDFDQNAVFFAEAEDIVITRNAIHSSYLRFLEEIGIISSNVHFLNGQGHVKEWPFSVFADTELQTRIKEHIKSQNGAETIKLDAFMLTEHEINFAQKLGVTYVGNPNHYYHYGSKSNFRSCMKQYGFSVPQGFEHRRDVSDVLLAAGLLFLKGFGDIVIKQDEGVAGLGSRVVAREAFLSSLRSLVDHLRHVSNVGVNPVRSAGFVVERWYNKTMSSPSVQLFISQDGKAHVLSTHAQLFAGNKLSYQGCYSEHYFTVEESTTVQSDALEIGNVLAKEGYRGHCSLNGIILSSGSLLWTELNPRRVISSYPHQIASRLFVDAKQYPYMVKRVFKKQWVNKGISKVLEDLRPFLFDKNSAKGVVPFGYNLLHSEGKVWILSVGDDKREIANRLAEVETI